MPVLPASSSPKSTTKPPADTVGRILHISVPVIVVLAERKLAIAEVMRLGVGAIIEFHKSSDEPLELRVNNKPIAQGETVKVGENFGLKVSRMGDLKSVIRSLGG
jgi:flagellar motor switch protein FliN/FliY